MNKRRIALISEHASPLSPSGGVDGGGQNIYVANVAKQLAKRGWLVDVFTRAEDATQDQVFDWLPNVRVIHVPAGPAQVIPKELLLAHMEDFADFMLGFIAEENIQYDLVHANFFMSGWVGMQLKRTLGIPLLITFHALGKVRRLHQGDADTFPDARFAIEEEIVANADRIIAECPDDRDNLVELYGADHTRIEIVPCGFDADEFSPVDRLAARTRLGWDSNDFTILQLGRLVPRKGIDDVIRAVAELKRRFRVNARLYVVGGNSEQPDPGLTPEIARLTALAVELRVDDQVSFVGRRDRDQLRYYYSAADVFVTTPWYEPFGITPVEAMACALPVVGTAVGGIQYSVADDHTGYLVRPHQPDALAAALCKLHGDPQRRREMGLAGQARANAMFTWPKIGATLNAIYADVLGEVSQEIDIADEEITVVPALLRQPVPVQLSV